MAIINPVRLGGAQSSGEWQRPSDWLPIPAITTGEEVIYILMAVYDVIGNFAAFKFQGDYTVDWGDGNIENVTSGVKAEHQYAWADVGDVTSEGFRQALIKITPQAGSNITTVDLQQPHTTIGNNKTSQFIDIFLNIPNLSGSMTIGGNFVFHRKVQRVWIKEVGVLTTTNYLFSYMISLQNVPLFDTSNVIDSSYMFYDCVSLAFIEAFDFSASTNVTYMFRGCTLLYYLTLTLSVATSLNYFLYYDYSLYSLDIINAASITYIPWSAFINCSNLQKVILNGITVGFTIANCQMSATALDEMFTALGTANGAQSITITGNYGAATCDQTIATTKGYTIVN